MAPRRSSLRFLSLLLAVGAPLAAEPVGSGLAAAAARQWLSSQPALWPARDRGVGSLRTHLDASGQPLFHEVDLEQGGFLLMAADDELEPVIAFADQGALEADPANPLYAMIQIDLQGRLSHLRRRSRPKTGDAFPLMTGRPSPEKAKWQALLGGVSPAGEYLAPLGSVSDLRVAPVVASKWNQSKVSGQNVYNYFTPNNYVCGCVATAMAQLMRYHQFPTVGIGAKPFTIYVDSAAQSATTRGGDGQGGPYAWSQMPLVPTGAILDAERQMIGALCFDAGLAVNMSYAASGSGSNMNAASQAFVKTFGYGNSICGSNGGELTGRGLLEMVQPNLDAGFPVLFGISGNGGHAIVCDGYGFNGSPATLYHHLNLGWGGNSDAWYNLPNIGTAYDFNLINACVYNVFPSGRGEIISGRITDGAGAPVAGVQVTNGSVTATSNANGIYALVHVAPGVQTLTATKAGASFPQAVRVLPVASTDGATVGNLPNVDLVQNGGTTPVILPQPVSQEVLPGGSLSFSAGATGVGPLHFQWLRNNQPVGTDGPTYTWSGIAASDDQSAIQVRVNGPQGAATSAAATVSVVYLINGGFENGSAGWSLAGSAAKSGTLYSLVSPHSGQGWARLGDHATAQGDSLSQVVGLPAKATRASLSFWMGIANDGADTTTVTNTATLKILDGSGSKLLDTLVTRNNTQAELDANGMVVWHPYGPYDLSKYAGQTITVRFESTQPGAKGTGTLFLVDDVRLPVTFGTAAPKATVMPGTWTMATGGVATFQAQVTGAVSDNRVSWAVSGGGGSFTPSQTAGDGKAGTVFTAGPTPGSFTVSATPVETGGTAGTSALTLVTPASVSVGLAPATAVVAPGLPITLAATVAPLSDARVTWSCTGGAFSAQGGTGATWSCPTPGTYTLTATAMGAPTRSATATVTVNGTPASLSLTPASAVLLPGASVTLTASGPSLSGVTWQVPSPLQHLENGLSTTLTAPRVAPLSTVIHPVTAASATNAGITGQAAITLKGMDLNGDGRLDPADLLNLASQWGWDAASPGNVKGLGVVDDRDLSALLDQLK